MTGPLSLRFAPEEAGNHVRVRVFAGRDPDHRALTGTLVFRADEWAVLSSRLAFLEQNGRLDLEVRP